MGLFTEPEGMSHGNICMEIYVHCFCSLIMIMCTASDCVHDASGAVSHFSMVGLFARTPLLNSSGVTHFVMSNFSMME